MIKDKETLFTYLVDQFPNFKAQWDSEDNYSRLEDGSFTSAGLCAEFSQYYIDEFSTIELKKMTNLFGLIEEVLSNPRLENELLDLSYSLKGCFLENISRTEAGERSKGLMGEFTRRFFDDWHIYP